MDKKIYRVLDANFNRLREALRVIEEFHRFLVPDRSLGLRIKNLRHGLQDLEKSLGISPADLLRSRDAKNDFGAKLVTPSEIKRPGTRQVLVANHKRAQEAARVLEEFAKIVAPSQGQAFKSFRFSLYQLEKNSTGR